MNFIKKLVLIAALLVLMTSISLPVMAGGLVANLDGEMLCHHFPNSEECAATKAQPKSQENPKKEFSNLMAVFGACMANTPFDELDEQFKIWKNEIIDWKEYLIEKGMSDLNILAVNSLRFRCGLPDIEKLPKPVNTKGCK